MAETKELPQARTVSVKEAAYILGVGKNLVYELIKSGEIPGLRLGRRVVILKTVLDSILAGGAAPREST